jgi:acetyl esterase/lipase
VSADQVLALDPEVRRALTVPTGRPPRRGDWKTRREGADSEFARINSLRPSPVGVSSANHHVTSSDGTDIRVRWYTPEEAAADGSPTAAVVFLHGGSMILGSIDHYDPIVQHYVAASGVPVLAVDYRLAPEHAYPIPGEDCYAALRWLAEHAATFGVDASRIAVMGDSAGGGLTAAVCLMARDRGGPPIARQLLLYPMLDDRTPARDPTLAEATFTVDDNAMGWQALLGDTVGTTDVSPYAAPARATDVSGLPPLYLDVGQVDILCAQDVTWALRLSAAGVPVELHVHTGANHAFDIYAPDAAVTQRAMADRVRVLQGL